METWRWQKEHWKTQENMARHTKRRSGGDEHRLKRQDDCCQRSCQLETNRRPVFCTELEELSLSLRLYAGLVTWNLQQCTGRRGSILWHSGRKKRAKYAKFATRAEQADGQIKTVRTKRLCTYSLNMLVNMMLFGYTVITFCWWFRSMVPPFLCRGASASCFICCSRLEWPTACRVGAWCIRGWE